MLNNNNNNYKNLETCIQLYLPVVLNETCMKPEKESTFIIFTRNTLEKEK